VIECRQRQQRNFLATLFLSQGVPMLLGGDEVGRTQGGNNNGYCQDNAVSWFDWNAVGDKLLEFARRLIAFRKAHAVLRRRRWFHGRPIRGAVDIGWFKPDGNEMGEQDWSADFARAIGVFLNGDAIPTRDARGRRTVDDSFLLLFNADPEPIEWIVPEMWPGPWIRELDTANPNAERVPSDARITTAGRSVIVLRRPRKS
jgi:isoamylase